MCKDGNKLDFVFMWFYSSNFTYLKTSLLNVSTKITILVTHLFVCHNWVPKYIINYAIRCSKQCLRTEQIKAWFRNPFEQIWSGDSMSRDNVVKINIGDTSIMIDGMECCLIVSHLHILCLFLWLNWSQITY